MNNLCSKKFAEAWASFVGVELDDAEARSLASELDGWEDATAKLILQTDFLERYPKVLNILKNYAPPVSRCILESPSSIVSTVAAIQTAKLRIHLFEQQCNLARKLAAIALMEQEILKTKQALSQARVVII